MGKRAEESLNAGLLLEANNLLEQAKRSELVPTIAEVRVMWFTKIENHIRHLPVLSPVALQ